MLARKTRSYPLPLWEREQSLPDARAFLFQTVKAPLPIFFERALGAPVFQHPSPSKKGARDIGVSPRSSLRRPHKAKPPDPRTSAPRGAKAVRRTKPQVRRSLGVPRAVF